MNVIGVITKLLLRRLGSFGKTAVGSFSFDSFLQILLLVVKLTFDDLLLLFATALTVFNDLFDFCVGMKLHLFQLLLVFLFFEKKSSSFPLEDFSDRRPENEVVEFLLIKDVLLGSSFLIELDSFLK